MMNAVKICRKIRDMTSSYFCLRALLCWAGVFSDPDAIFEPPAPFDSRTKDGMDSILCTVRYTLEETYINAFCCDCPLGGWDQISH